MTTTPTTLSALDAAKALIALAHTGPTTLDPLDGDDVGGWIEGVRRLALDPRPPASAAEIVLWRLVKTVWNGTGDVTIPEIADAFGPTTKAAVFDILKARFA